MRFCPLNRTLPRVVAAGRIALRAKRGTGLFCALLLACGAGKAQHHHHDSHEGHEHHDHQQHHEPAEPVQETPAHMHGMHHGHEAGADGYRMLHHWSFRPADAEAAWGHSEVPNNLHLDLVRLGAIPHPWIKTNIDSVQWVHQRDWIYTHELELTEADLNSGHPELVFEGLDTYAEVLINGKPMLQADNAFRNWRIENAGDMLRPGKNQIEVHFKAPDRIETRIQERTRIDWPGGDRVLTRKPAYHDGWDWAPKLPTMGIWRNAYFHNWNTARLLDVALRLDSLSLHEPDPRSGVSASRRMVRSAEGWTGPPFDPDTAWMTLAVEFEADAVQDLLLQLGDAFPELEWTVRSKNGRQRVERTLAVPAPKLWWTWDLLHASQDPHLYRAAVLLQTAEGDLLDQRRFHTGLRIIDLDTTRQGPDTARFAFRLNGVELFARGANWVPTSTFLYGYLPDYARLLNDARTSNLNMLRVWGGGVYEWDAFYETCDRLGILVWQDAMFACGMVPGENTRYPQFTQNVEREIREQARRLRRHPSLALWCGNNEIAEGWERWGWQNGRSKRERERLEADYVFLFEQGIPEWIAEEDPYTPYWPSSPEYGRADPRAYTTGDAHDWWVWHDGRPLKSLEYRLPRFMSEFGFQAYPDLRTIAAWRGGYPALFDSTDAFLKAHQKHPRGVTQIHRFLQRELGEALPDSFAQYVYLSQWLQGEGMARAVAAQRRNRPWTMGSLYWQFNDVWPAVSWSGIDVDGRWKAMQYRLQRAYAAIAPSLWVDSVVVDGQAQERWGLALVNDTRLPENVVWTVKALTASGENLYEAAGYSPLEPGRVDTVWKAETQKLEVLQRDDVLLHTEVRRMGEALGQDTRMLCSPCNWPLAESGLTYRIEHEAGGWPVVLVRVEHPAIGVWLHSPYEGRFSENGFDLMPGREMRVEFKAPFGRKPGWNVEVPDPKRFAESLRIFTLGDVLEGPRSRAVLDEE